MAIKAPQFDGGNNLPPEVQARISAVVARAVEKIDPELQEITKILKASGIQGSISFGMMPTMGIPSPFNQEFGFPFFPPTAPIPAPAKAPEMELVAGIKHILDNQFGECAEQILGMTYDPHFTTAQEIAKIMDAARKRDRESLARELDAISNKIKHL